MDITQLLSSGTSLPSSPQQASGVPSLGSFLSKDSQALGDQGAMDPTKIVPQATAINANLATGAQQSLMGLFQETSAQMQEAQVADQIRLNTAQTGMQNAQFTKQAMDAFQANTKDLQAARDSRFQDYQTALVNKVKADQETPHIWQNPIGYFEGHLKQGFYGQQSDEALGDVSELQHAINVNLANTTQKIQEYTTTNNTLAMAQNNLQAASALQGLQAQQIGGVALQQGGKDLEGTSQRIFGNVLETVSAQDRQKQQALSQEEMNLQLQQLRDKQNDREQMLDSAPVQYLAWVASGGKTTQIPSDDQSRSDAMTLYEGMPKDQQNEINQRSFNWQRNMKAGAYGTNGASPIQQELMSFSGTASPGVLKTLASISGNDTVGQFIDGATMGSQRGILHQMVKQAYLAKSGLPAASVSDAYIDSLDGSKTFGGKEFAQMVKDSQLRATNGAVNQIAVPYANDLETQMSQKFGEHGTGYTALAANPSTLQSLAHMGVDPLLLSMVGSPDGKQLITPVNPTTGNADITTNLVNALIEKGMTASKAAQAVATFNKMALIANGRQQGLAPQIDGATFLGANFNPQLQVQGPYKKYMATDPVDILKMREDYKKQDQSTQVLLDSVQYGGGL